MQKQPIFLLMMMASLSTMSYSTSSLTNKALVSTTMYFASHVLHSIDRVKKKVCIPQDNLPEKQLFMHVIHHYERVTTTHLPSDLQRLVIKFLSTDWDIQGFNKYTGTRYDLNGFNESGIHRITKDIYNQWGFRQNGDYKELDKVTKKPTKYDPSGYDICRVNREGKGLYRKGFDHRALPSTIGLCRAIAKKDLWAIQRILREPIVDINDYLNYCTPIYLAVEKGDLETILLLLSYPGIEVNYPHKLTQESLLHVAARRFDKRLITLLFLQPSIDVNRVNIYDETALHIACRTNNEYMVILLTRHHGVNPNIKDCNGNTPLHVACSYGHNKVAIMLLKDSRVHVNSYDSYGIPLLHHAFEEGNKIVIRHLICHRDIDLNQEDNEGCNMLDILFKELVQPKRSYSRKACKRLWHDLVSYGAKLHYYKYTHHNIKSCPKVSSYTT